MHTTLSATLHDDVMLGDGRVVLDGATAVHDITEQGLYLGIWISARKAR